jgi:hypothetical protein
MTDLVRADVRDDNLLSQLSTGIVTLRTEKTQLLMEEEGQRKESDKVPKTSFPTWNLGSSWSYLSPRLER